MRANESEATLLRSLAALEELLDRRLTQAIEDVAQYPTPIARCDVQLTKLLEERSEWIVRLDAVRSVAKGSALTTRAGRDGLQRLLDNYPSPDDMEEARVLAEIMALTLYATA